MIELERAVETATTLPEKIQALIALTKHLKYSDSDRAVALAESALRFCADYDTYAPQRAEALPHSGALILGSKTMRI